MTHKQMAALMAHDTSNVVHPISILIPVWPENEWEIDRGEADKQTPRADTVIYPRISQHHQVVHLFVFGIQSLSILTTFLIIC